MIEAGFSKFLLAAISIRTMPAMSLIVRSAIPKFCFICIKLVVSKDIQGHRPICMTSSFSACDFNHDPELWKMMIKIISPDWYDHS